LDRRVTSTARLALSWSGGKDSALGRFSRLDLQ
jgi:hypothetical protein